MIADVVKSVSIENLLNQRRAVVSLVTEARDLLLKASELANAAHLGNLSDLFSPHRYTHADIYFLKPDGAETVIKVLDGGGWRYLMDESGMRTFMDAEARNKWGEALHKGDYPELTRENIAATFGQLHGARGEMFERGVIALFRSLSRGFRTNEPVKFGKRIIVRCVLSVWGAGGMYSSLNNRATDTLDDLVRVFCVFDGKPEPDHRQGIYYALSAAEKNGIRQWEGDYFKIRWYKNGNGHLTFKRLDLVQQMNCILARHYPNALAAEIR
jgi:hypothetical protein